MQSSRKCNLLTSLFSGLSAPLLVIKSSLLGLVVCGDDLISLDNLPLPVGVDWLVIGGLCAPFFPQSQLSEHSLLFVSAWLCISVWLRVSITWPLGRWLTLGPWCTNSEQCISIGWEYLAGGAPWCRFICGCEWTNGGLDPNGPHIICSLCHGGEWCCSLDKTRDDMHDRPSTKDDGLAWVALKGPFDKSSQSSSFHGCSSIPFWKHS